MKLKNRHVSRRNVLRGMLNGSAVAVSLPILNLFLNENGNAFAGTGAQLPERFGTWFWGLGVDPGIYAPKDVGYGYTLSPQLLPLEPVKEHINVFSNFNVLTDGRPNLCHYTGWVALRCGAAPSGRGDLPGQSLDTTIGQVIGDGTRFRSLNLAATGVPRHSYSFLSADAVNPPDVSALEFYQKVFGAEFQDPNSPNFTPDPGTMVRKSVLSAVSEDRKDFMRGLGAEDRTRLDQYFTSIRELENRLALQLEPPPPAPTCVSPAVPDQVPVGMEVNLVSARHRAMTDLLVMALACNQTKIFNMVYSDSASSLTREGLDKTHHIFTHEEPVNANGYQPESSYFVKLAIDEWVYFVQALANMPEGDGSVLDHSIVYAHTDCQFAKTHSIDGIPMFTAGGLNGRVKTGQHIDGQGEAGTRLGYTLQRLFGVPIASWGRGSMEVSREISEIIV